MKTASDKTAAGGRTTFGGLIRLSDFNTTSRPSAGTGGSVTAARILNDLRFDEQCGKNYENRLLMLCMKQEAADGE